MLNVNEIAHNALQGKYMFRRQLMTREQYYVSALKKRIDKTYKVKLSSKSRKRKVVYLRIIFVNMVLKHTKFSYETTGSYIKRDHSSVSYYLNKYQDYLYYPDFVEYVERLK